MVKNTHLNFTQKPFLIIDRNLMKFRGILIKIADPFFFMDFHLFLKKEWLDLIFRRRENQIPSFSLPLTNDCKNQSISLFIFRFFGLKFILSSISFASVGRAFRGLQAQCPFYRDRRSE